MQTSRWPISKLPIAHLEPFPYHKGELYVELLDRLAKYVTDQLHPNLRKTVEHMIEELEQILALQHGKYVEGIQDFQRIHDAFMEDVNSALMALNDDAVADLADDPGSALGSVLRDLIPQQVRSQDLIVSKGRTDQQDAAKVGVARTFVAEEGDLFDNETRLELSIRNQQGTKQNPPGYSYGAITLIEDGPGRELYSGETTRISMISNRILFNKRLEIDMGSGVRPVMRGSITPGEEQLQLSFHNYTSPRVRLFGPNNTSHNGGRRNKFYVEEADLVIEGKSGTPLRIVPSNQGDNHTADWRTYGGGHQALNVTTRTNYTNYPDSVHTHVIGFHPDGRMRLVSPLGTVIDTPIIQSPNGTMWELTVSNTGELSTREVN